jgi:NAD(P)-dependent dehydrogenase (short-subunit alcohol dehydrogenase family)
MEAGVGKLEGKTVVVVGAGSGIGRASARLMASHGANVVVADINLEGATAVAREIEDAGGNAIASFVDVAAEETVAAIMDLAVRQFGRLDVVHNNAAALGPEVLGRDETVGTMDVEVWDQTMTINARGAMLGCKYAVGPMIENGGGSIVNTSSAAARTGDRVRVAYGCSKAAIDSLTRYVAAAYGKYSIRCNAVAPGLTVTEYVRNKRTDEEINVMRQTQLTPELGGRPEDIANVVAFLASDESAFITAQTICADGGMLSYMPSMGKFG